MSEHCIKKTYRRDWLNLGEGSDFIELDSELDGFLEDSSPQLYNCDLSIADCNRQITLDFCVWFSQGREKAVKEVDNAKHKIEVLRSYLDMVSQDLAEIENNLHQLVEEAEKK